MTDLINDGGPAFPCDDLVQRDGAGRLNGAPISSPGMGTSAALATPSQEAAMSKPDLLPTVWIMRTADGWYPIQPSVNCKPEDHGRLNDHVLSIEDEGGNTIWRRAVQ